MARHGDRYVLVTPAFQRQRQGKYYIIDASLAYLLNSKSSSITYQSSVSEQTRGWGDGSGVKELAALAKDSDLVPNNSTICNSRTRDPDVLSQPPPQTPGMPVIHSHT